MKAILVILIGVSGSGKSTYAEALKTSLGVTVVSTDDIRFELTRDATDQSRNNEVFNIAKRRVSDLLASGKNAAIDATSVSRKDRRDWVDIGKRFGADIRAYVINTPLDVAKKRNLGRDRKVPEFVIDKQYSRFQTPVEAEGFDKITAV